MGGGGGGWEGGRGGGPLSRWRCGDCWDDTLTESVVGECILALERRLDAITAPKRPLLDGAVDGPVVLRHSELGQPKTLELGSWCTETGPSPNALWHDDAYATLCHTQVNRLRWR